MSVVGTLFIAEESMTKEFTKLTYSYTDTQGRFVSSELHLKGRLHNHTIFAIEANLKDRESFIPGALDLDIPELQSLLPSFPSIHDRVFHKLDLEHVDYVESLPEGVVGIDLYEFISALEAVGEWDAASAEERLGVGASYKGRPYELSVRSEGDSVGVPTLARFHILEVDAEKIIHLSQVVQENGLYKVEKFDYRTSWLHGDASDEELVEVSSDLDLLNVSANDFWFTAAMKHTDVEVTTERKPISELREWLGAQDIAKATVATAPRVLVVVNGGVADPVFDAGVDVEVFDWDNYEADPEGTKGVPDHFADIAARCGVPLASQAASDVNRGTGRERG